VDCGSSNQSLRVSLSKRAEGMLRGERREEKSEEEGKVGG
jgi:hypothetical protein